MKAGINIKVCRDSGCTWSENFQCLLRKCPRCEGLEQGWEFFMGNMCPLPDECEYKNLHILNYVEMDVVDDCPDECKKLAGLK